MILLIQNISTKTVSHSEWIQMLYAHSSVDTLENSIDQRLTL